MAAHGQLDEGRSVPLSTSVQQDVRRLSSKLDESLPALRCVDSFYDGTNPSLLASAERLRESKLSALVGVTSNWCAPAVDLLAERVVLAGHRLPGAAETDADLAEAWRAAGGAAATPTAITEALTHGWCGLLVWGDEEGRPRVTVESALTTAVSADGLTALKRWRDPDGYGRALLLTPFEVRRLRSAHPVVGDVDPHFDLGAVGDWQVIEVVDNPLGRLPLARLVHRTRNHQLDGASVLTPTLRSLQQVLSKLLVDLVVASETAALPRRWATGVERPIDPATGQELDPFAGATGTSHLFLVEAAEAKLGAWPAADVEGILASIKAVVEQFAALAAIPPHMTLGASGATGQQVSAESVRAAETALISRSKRAASSLSAGLAEAMRLVVLVRDGRLPPGAELIEPVFADPGTPNLAGSADAAAKLVQLGVSLPVALREVMGWSPSTVAAATAGSTALVPA